MERDRPQFAQMEALSRLFVPQFGQFTFFFSAREDASL
jgi:hypothetical protein